MKHVEVDRRGEFLRVDLQAAETVAAVVALLQELGFAAEPIAEAPGDARQWYRRASVGELSREEAGVIARRVVPAFAKTHDLAADEGDRLVELVTVALHRSFLANVVDATVPIGALHHECGRAVEAATVSQLRADRASELGRAIEADLAAGRSSKPE